MGWSYRKSVSFGPFRVNLSKAGIGYSVGGMGFREGVNSRGRSYRSESIPGTGIRYYSSGNNSTTGCLLTLIVVAIALATASGCVLLVTWSR